MKKLDITAVEYQHRNRKLVKKRVVRYREEQKKKGFKNLTVFLSEDFRAELQKLSTEKDYNRQQAMQYIFDVYMQKAMHGVTSNAKQSKDKTDKQPAIVETVKKPNKTTAKKQLFDKAKICSIIVDLRDNKKMTYSAIARELKTRGYRPQTAGKNNFHHSTIINYYKESIKNIDWIWNMRYKNKENFNQTRMELKCYLMQKRVEILKHF